MVKDFAAGNRRYEYASIITPRNAPLSIMAEANMPYISIVLSQVVNFLSRIEVVESHDPFHVSG